MFCPHWLRRSSPRGSVQYFYPFVSTCYPFLGVRLSSVDPLKLEMECQKLTGDRSWLC